MESLLRLQSADSQPTSLLECFRRVRDLTLRLCDPLQAGDFVVQSAPQTSPAKWHLAHTAWFFENFLLVPFVPDYRPYHPLFGYYLDAFSLASRLVTNGEYIEFIEAGGYRQPTFWLSEGWRKVNEERWQFMGLRLAA